MKRILQKPLLWIILASILPVLSLLHPGMPILHDGQDHVARIANFYAAIREGILIPRWAANLNWGYGHPILMFLYPLPEYIASLFHFVGFTLVDSTKLVFGLSFIASAAAMFLWMNAAWGTRAGIIGAILYVFAPYRFVDLYVRGAIGEHVAFIFPPLVLCFLFKKRWKLAALALALLVLSHNAISLMFIPVIGLYGLYLFLDEKKKSLFVIHFVSFIIFGLSLSAFFWLPALFEGKYTLREIVTAGEALKRFVPWTWFVYSPWNYGGTETLTKALGFPQWIGILGSVVLFIRTKNKKRKVFIAGLLSVLLISLFIMTSASTPLWRASALLQNFQFPWRFLSVSVFMAAVLGGIAFARANKLFLILYSLFIIVISVGMWFPKGYQAHDESFYSGVYAGTTDTGESSPVWSVRFMEHAPASALEVIDGDAAVTMGKRTTTLHEYTVSAQKPTLMMENTLYFPGWTISVNGKPAVIEWQNPNYRGLMMFRLPQGANQTVRVVFEDTKVRTIADWISIISVVVLLWLKIK
jgi:uncharacterized membrane protein